MSVGYPLFSALFGAWWSFTLLPAFSKFHMSHPLQLADRSAGLIWSEVKPIPPNRMGQCHGTHLFSAECNTWQLASLKWWYMQDKMLWAAFFLAVATNIRYHEGLEPPLLWPPGVWPWQKAWKAWCHLSSCNVHHSGRPWTRFDHAAPVPSFNHKHGHCTACRMCWDLILVWITSGVAIHSVWLPACCSKLLSIIPMSLSDEGYGQLGLPHAEDGHSRALCPACWWYCLLTSWNNSFDQRMMIAVAADPWTSNGLTS
jgi:hypothetical protein